MHPDALKKLWACSQGKVPHLSKQQYEGIITTSGAISEAGGLEYWGIVAESTRYRGHMLLHCYNFGSCSADCPWSVNLVNFGQTLPARIISCGTLRRRDALDEVPLDKLQQPYLVFAYEMDAGSSEFLEAGMLVSQGTIPEQRLSYDVVFPDDPEPPNGEGVLSYYLMKEVSFTAKPVERWVAPGAPVGFPRVRLVLDQPMVLEAGWPVLLLDNDRALWGVVVS